MAEAGFSVLILAAGKATRFKSSRSKLLHPLAGRPLGEYVLCAAVNAGPDQVYMVVGHQAERVREAFARPGLTFVEQTQQLGTGHAVMAARELLERSSSRELVVLVGDAPLLSSGTLRRLVGYHRQKRAAATALSMVPASPHGYGRIVRGRDRRVKKIVEEKAATTTERRIREVSSGILCFARTKLLSNLVRLSADNPQREYLLTDFFAILAARGDRVEALPVTDVIEVLGVNDRAELAAAERILRMRKAEALMLDGVTIVNPEVTYIDDSVMVGGDTVIEPGVTLRGATQIGKECVVGAYSTLTDATLGDRVTVRPYSVVSASELGSDTILGPFGNVRDGSMLEPGSRIGNFVEVKKSRIGRGTKAWHLTYLGDANLGERANIGAGTVTCNYDGENKNATVIEDDVFVGSGSMLVAPVRIGAGSYVAAGSTITEDVPPDSLALGRARQVVKEGWVAAKKPSRAQNRR
jgi:bifunctional UDP-N-acetylglucosamine pyrophosphorylase / glucosamine-1-phosphate N-acetyltransferase